MRIFIVVLVFLFSIVFICGYSQTKLPSIFSNHMVLQQNEEVAIWGSDLPFAEVAITTSWGSFVAIRADREGNWNLRIRTPGADTTSQQITIQGGEKIVLEDVLIGEVWLCSGQSNMEMPYKTFVDSYSGKTFDSLPSLNNKIRVLELEKVASLIPLSDIGGEWTPGNPSAISNFSAVAVSFGNQIHNMLNVPIGLIHGSWSGSTIEAWMSPRSLMQSEENHSADSTLILTNYTPSVLYNGMISPLQNFSIKGVIWYQGESNVEKHSQYQQQFQAMIRGWRSQWSRDFPFYFVQIAPYEYGNVNSALLREAQFISMREAKNTGMVVTLDLADCNDVHDTNKYEIGNRLARWALSETYGIVGLESSGPLYHSMIKTDEGKIKITFDYVYEGLVSSEHGLSDFLIAGEDKIFINAKAVINSDNTITVWSDDIKKPEAVRYAFDNCVIGSLFNKAGLPASSFRTDSWVD